MSKGIFSNLSQIINEVINHKEDNRPDPLQSLDSLLSRTRDELAILKGRKVEVDAEATLALAKQIEVHQQIIVLIEGAIERAIEGARQDKGQATTNKINIGKEQRLFFKIENQLKHLSQSLDSLSKYFNSISFEITQTGGDFLHITHQKIDNLKTDWGRQKEQENLTAKDNQPFLNKALQVEKNVHLLKRWQIDLRNHQLLQEKLAQQQVSLPADVLDKTLKPQIEHITAQIKLLQQEGSLDTQDKKLLQIHEHNYRLCQQMLSGERMYAPIDLLNQLEAVAHNLSEIELEFAQLLSGD